MTQTILPAVDELAQVRGTIAELRLRELELCDEIRAMATQTGTRQVIGESRTAMIETRAARCLNLSKLPDEVLSDPKMFDATPKTHVLLWPNAAATAPAALTQHDADDIEMPQDLSATSEDDALEEMNELAQDPAQDDVSLELESPSQDDVLEETDTMSDTASMADDAKGIGADALASLEAPTEPNLQEIDSFSDAPDTPQNVGTK